MSPRPERSWARPLGDPLAWTAADKCLLVVAIMLPGTGLFALLGHMFDGWVYLPSEPSPNTRDMLDHLTLVAAVAWTMMLAVGLILRKRAPENRLYVVVTVMLYSVTVAVLVSLSGGFHSPGWIVFIGGAVVGFLLFGWTITFVGIFVYLVVFTGILVAAELGYLGDLSEITHPPIATGSDWSWWLVRMGVSTLVFGTVTLGLCAYIIALLRDREALLEHMSKTDSLTGLTNRRELMRLLEHEFTRAQRYDTPLSCVMIDLDHFKLVNDEHGHLAGDRVLVEVADVICKSVRETDTVARYGGEEFVLVLPNTDTQGASELAERCRDVLARTEIDDEDGRLTVTASMGVASCPDLAVNSVDDLLNAADRALYVAKNAGRNRVELASTVASITE